MGLCAIKLRLVVINGLTLNIELKLMGNHKTSGPPCTECKLRLLAVGSLTHDIWLPQVHVQQDLPPGPLLGYFDTVISTLNSLA